ncbi:endonuclease [Stenotrophomonas sp. MYb238]|uniref:S1/P1 nuclease n=1 Tax=Stenotrophomonas sp. MYb238 TaxID=2040281 RepID=UPI001291043D|nr:S1/P1 nuclease [Stenotrophomonas sp. MYb238]MQP76680.1 endonuclease [Stenotrophomonas sp. MYb238]
MKFSTRVPVLLSGLALAVTALLPAPASAWGAQGHRLVARIAETHLDPAAKAEVARLLAAEPGATLASIAPWADQLRAEDPDLGKRSAGWHYVNMAEDGCIYDPPKHCRDGDCVIEALKVQSARLADRSLSDADRLQALKFVVHLAGDMHQPMHAGYGHDKGGNTYQLQFNERGTNLHSLWDSGMFYALQLDDDQYLQRLQALPAPAGVAAPQLQRDASLWAEQSCRIATREGVYPANRKVGQAYADTWRPVAEAQLRLAGERLAALLNELLDHP